MIFDCSVADMYVPNSLASSREGCSTPDNHAGSPTSDIHSSSPRISMPNLML